MIFFLVLFLTGLFISSIAAWFSILGLTAVFPGAFAAVVLLGASIEIGKLVGVSWLYRFWTTAPRLMRATFVALVAGVSLVTSIGIFGLLTKAHVEGSVGVESGSDQIALLDDQISFERQTIDANKNVLKQMDQAVSNLVAAPSDGTTTNTERAIKVRASQRVERSKVSAALAASNARSIALSQQKAQLNITQRKLETDLGPIKYVAQLVYGNQEKTSTEKAVLILTLLLIFVFDPLAIMLMLAANMQLNELKKLPREILPKPPVLPPILPKPDGMPGLPPNSALNQEPDTLNPLSLRYDPREDAWNPAEIIKTRDIARTKRLLKKLNPFRTTS